MNVLFVSSGNSKNGISPIVKRQGESIICAGADVHYFSIQGKGLIGYLSNIKKLKAAFKKIRPEIVHAHYSMSAYLATLACAKPLIVSLMGSDVKSSGFSKFLIKIFNKFSWNNIIVKSEDLYNSLGIKNVSIIPNGVNIVQFYPMGITESHKELKWDTSKKHVLFVANPGRPEKNFILAKNAFELLSFDEVELHSLTDVCPDQIPLWINASDTVLLTSLWEGSPNVIKEAMACGRPIVATDVGDIKWLFNNEPGHFLTSFEPEDVAKKIRLALEFSEQRGRTNGRQRIIESGLDSETVAHKIIGIYKSVLTKSGTSQ